MNILALAPGQAPDDQNETPPSDAGRAGLLHLRSERLKRAENDLGRLQRAERECSAAARQAEDAWRDLREQGIQVRFDLQAAHLGRALTPAQIHAWRERDEAQRARETAAAHAHLVATDQAQNARAAREAGMSHYRTTLRAVEKLKLLTTILNGGDLPR